MTLKVLRASLLASIVYQALAGTNAFIELPSISVIPQNASQILDPRLASFSIELAYLPFV